MKKLIEWSRKLLFPVFILAAIIFVLSRDSGRMMKSVVPSQPNKKSFSAEQPKEPNKGNVAEGFTQQMDDLKRSVLKDPKNISHLVMLATMLMDGHNPKEAIQYFERVRLLEPKNISNLLDLSVCYAETGNTGEAFKVTNTLLRVDPKNPAALYNKGAIYAQQGKMVDAEQSWKKLITIAPNSSEAKKAEEALKRIGRM